MTGKKEKKMTSEFLKGAIGDMPARSKLRSKGEWTKTKKKKLAAQRKRRRRNGRSGSWGVLEITLRQLGAADRKKGPLMARRREKTGAPTG